MAIDVEQLLAFSYEVNKFFNFSQVALAHKHGQNFTWLCTRIIKLWTIPKFSVMIEYQRYAMLSTGCYDFLSSNFYGFMLQIK